MPRFYVISGHDLGRTHDVGEGATFGRAAECAVTLRGTSISRQHAQLEKHGDVWVLVDLGSRNGIAKHGARSERIELADGDVVRLGDVELRFRASAGAIGETDARPARAPEAPADPAPPAPRDELRFEDIELEDDIGELQIDFDPEATAYAPRVGPPAAAPEPARGAPGRVAERAAAAGIAVPASGLRGSGPVELRESGRAVLQFQKVHDRPGFLVADLAQYPAWVKLAAGVLVAAVFVAIFWFAFRGVALLKGDGAGAPDVAGDEASE